MRVPEIRLKQRLAYYSSEILIELFGSATLCNSAYPHWMAAISSLAGISFAATFNQVNKRSFAGDYLWTLENLKMKWYFEEPSSHHLKRWKYVKKGLWNTGRLLRT